MTQIIRAENNSYTSQLNITVSSGVIGKSIECVHDNYVNTTVVGTFKISPITGMSHSWPIIFPACMNSCKYVHYSST